MTRMLRTICVALAAAMLLMGAATAKRVRVTPPAVGAPAPDFQLVDQDGRRVALSALRGQKVVLVFYRGYW